ncbi:Type I phosphodiesterase / nucleotide pyrophosphatase [Planctomycetes bacterium Pan216]|uniref:Type I phosphodiesterase / nucleotide pyrophosphatase n=1 Tax=Kolteria novifilia TaxID=2527975 RepID=A0A518AY67_9BACT|nr:Type I phosphodiesterase / nucleotide pyrophosphatase [Planctomycetes bacterium Pan216]
MSKPRVIVVGMDGATFTILKPLIDQGKLPTLAKIMNEGVAGPLASVTPPITPAAWSSFYTGKQPGKHGVFEFLYRRPDSYSKVPVNFTSIRGKKFWDYAGASGKRVCLYNLPLLYPTPDVNGVAVSGLLTPDGVEDFGTPSGIIPEIEKEVGGPYVLGSRAVYRKGNAGKILEEFHRVLTYHMKSAQYLLQKEPWDVFFGHLMVTDSMQHELWHLLDPTHSAHDPEEAAEHMPQIEAIYQRIDQEFLAPIVDSLDEETTLLIMSDHGFGGIEHIIYMNMWLLQRGYVTWSKDWWTQAKAMMHRWGVTPKNFFRVIRWLGLGELRDRVSLEARETWMNRGFMNIRRADWSNTKAYAMGNILGMLYLNVKGREPDGAVEPGEEYEKVRTEIIEKLQAEKLPETGEPLFSKVQKGEEIYEGLYAKYGPDIVCTPTDWRYQVFGYQDFVSNKFVETYSEMTGHHRVDGIFFGMGKAFQHGLWLDDAKLLDLAPTLLHLIGLPIPSDMDGRVLEEAFDDDAWDYPEMLAVDETAEEETAAVELSEEDQKLVMQRLKDLGYEDGL